MQLRTNRVVVTFQHSDGSFSEAGMRAIRIMGEGPHKGMLCIERRKRLLPITVTSPTTATCNLGADPLASGYAEAQAVAPVATLAALGVAPREPKAPTAPKAAAPKAAPKAAEPAPAMVAHVGPPTLEEAIAAVREHMAGKPLAEAQAILTSLVTVGSTPKAARRNRKAR